MTPEALVLQSSPIVTVGYIMQILFSLAIIIGLIFIVARFILPKMKITPSGRIIQILDRVYLEPQVAAYIIKVGEKAWLVITSNKQVAKIDEVGKEVLS